MRGQCLHQPAAGGDQRHRVGQGEHTGQVRGAQLADGVADQPLRAQAVRLDREPVQGDVQGEQGGLGVGGGVQQGGRRGAGLGEQHLGQRRVQMRGEQLRDLVHGGPERRLARVQFTAGARPRLPWPE